jgi:hypothetical protein
VFCAWVLSASSVVVGDLWVVAARRVKFVEQACSFSCGLDFHLWEPRIGTGGSCGFCAPKVEHHESGKEEEFQDRAVQA